MGQETNNEHPAEEARRDISKGKQAGEVRAFLDDLNVKFCWCPEGSCEIGEPPSPHNPNRRSSQTNHRFEYGFWMSQTVVTQDLWTRVRSTKPWWGDEEVREGAHYPATFICWFSATDFCNRLTQREEAAGRLPYGWRFRLPSSTEWEYACRAGTKTFYYFCDDIDDVSPYAWFDKNTVAKDEPYAHEVGMKLPNPWGLFDMHGNVDEWCRDTFRGDLAEGVEAVRAEDEHFAYRGGSWNDTSEECQSHCGYGEHPYCRSSSLGFRLVLSVGRFD